MSLLPFEVKEVVSIFLPIILNKETVVFSLGKPLILRVDLFDLYILIFSVFKFSSILKVLLVVCIKNLPAPFKALSKVTE